MEQRNMYIFFPVTPPTLELLPKTPAPLSVALFFHITPSHPISMASLPLQQHCFATAHINISADRPRYAGSLSTITQSCHSDLLVMKM